MRHVMLAIVAALMLGLAPHVRADAASHAAAARQLVASMDMQDLMDKTVDQTLELQMQQNPSLRPYRDVMQKFFRKYLSWQSIEPDMIKLYVETFTEDELKDITRFYQTPTGKKAVKTLPELMAKGAEIGQRKVQANIAELQQMVAAEDARLKGSPSTRPAQP